MAVPGSPAALLETTVVLSVRVLKLTMLMFVAKVVAAHALTYVYVLAETVMVM